MVDLIVYWYQNSEPIHIFNVTSMVVYPMIIPTIMSIIVMSPWLYSTPINLHWLPMVIYIHLPALFTTNPKHIFPRKNKIANKKTWPPNCQCATFHTVSWHRRYVTDRQTNLQNHWPSWGLSLGPGRACSCLLEAPQITRPVMTQEFGTKTPRKSGFEFRPSNTLR